MSTTGVEVTTSSTARRRPPSSVIKLGFELGIRLRWAITTARYLHLQGFLYLADKLVAINYAEPLIDQGSLPVEDECSRERAGPFFCDSVNHLLRVFYILNINRKPRFRV